MAILATRADLRNLREDMIEMDIEERLELRLLNRLLVRFIDHAHDIFEDQDRRLARLEKLILPPPSVAIATPVPNSIQISVGPAIVTQGAPNS